MACPASPKQQPVSHPPERAELVYKFPLKQEGWWRQSQGDDITHRNAPQAERMQHEQGRNNREDRP